MELPPRARRIRSGFDCDLGLTGTTSACAENTDIRSEKSPCGWNYLRVRGEYPPGRRWEWAWIELPPRARRIQWEGWLQIGRDGTTSACAENTLNELGLL